MKSPAHLLRSLLIDIGRLHTEAKCLDRDLTTIEYRVEHEGDSFLTITLPILGRAILDGLTEGRLTCPKNFKKVRGGAIPRLFSGMLCQVFDVKTGLLLAEHDTGIVASLLQCTMLFSKLTTSDEHRRKLDAQTRSKFEREDSQITGRIDPLLRFLISRISRFVLADLHRFAMYDVVGKQGPGAVYDGHTPNQKWKAVWDGIKNNTILSLFGYEPRELTSVDSTSFLYQTDLFGRVSPATSHVARLVTVPKSAKALRTITVEPCLNQFIQQGLGKVLREAIERCPVLSSCLALTDQSKNCELARIGSISGHYATIDLSSASDLLSQELVEAVFGQFKEFYDSLNISRTQYCENEGKLIRLRKYAGMGNATTFPVQSVCFAIISIAGLLISARKFPTYRNVRSMARRVRVYGDDIIVPTDSYASVANQLEAAGLSVNRSKSYSRGNFRESCGGDYYKGELVRPLYIRHRLARTAHEALGNYVCVANMLYARCYYTASAYLKKTVEETLGFTLPYVRASFPEKDHLSDFSRPVALGWVDRVGSYNTVRYCKKLHRPLVRTAVIVPSKRYDPIDSYPALMKSFHVPIEGRGTDHDLWTVRRFSTKLKRRWVAV